MTPSHRLRTPRSGRTLAWAGGLLTAGALTAAVLVVSPGGDAATTAPAAASGHRHGGSVVAATTGRSARPADAGATRLRVSAHSAATPPAANPCANRPDGRSILVDISQQHAWMCRGRHLARSSPVTTGADVPDRRTPTGSWQITGKQTHRWLGGPGYSVQVNYWMPYNGDFGLHDATWQKMPFGSPGYRARGSHGCVHFPLATMAWVYRWAPVGTPIRVRR